MSGPGSGSPPAGSGGGARGGRGRLVVVGDTLLDRDLDGRVERLSPDAPVPIVEEPLEHARPGGAGLAAALAAADGRPVTLVTALGADPGGRELHGLLEAAGVEVVDLGLDGTTSEKVRIRGGGRTLLRVDRGDGRCAAPRPGGSALAGARTALASAAGVLVSDYGRGVAADPGVRAALAARPDEAPLVWDPHPRGPEPVAGALLVTPNAGEAAGFASETGSGGAQGAAARARALAERWDAELVCVTLGGEGALLVAREGAPIAVPAVPAAGGDPCGAGDRFASWAAGLLADGEPPAAAVADAVVCASRFVAAGGAAGAGAGRRSPGGAAATASLGRAPRSEAPGAGVRTRPSSRVPRAAHPTRGRRPIAVPAPIDEAAALVAEVRAGDGTPVATGGCFDLLHAGHVSMLEAARALGDCLVVLLNSDRSVARLKGPDRPLVEEADRAAVLAALHCVDAVVVFDEDTPEVALDRLRPDLFAKGGDYAVADLPEAALLERWGGEAVILPYVTGRSTTRLIEEVALRGPS